MHKSGLELPILLQNLAACALLGQGAATRHCIDDISPWFDWLAVARQGMRERGVVPKLGLTIPLEWDCVGQ